MLKNKQLSIFLLTHLIIWTAVPSLTNSNLPLDTIEALAWGSNLDWGFNKHPPLSAFAVEVFYQIFGSSDWSYYLLSQLFVTIAIYFVFKLSIEILNSEKSAFISILLLEGIFFYNFTTPEFNVNVCMLPFWAMTGYYSYKCLKNNYRKDYIILGVVAALGFLSKYLFIYLLIGVMIFYLFYIFKNNFKVNYIVPGLIFLLILIPHFIWLTENDYITIAYGLKRTGEIKNYFDHFILPLTFLAKQIGILIPFFILLFALTKNLKTSFSFKDQNFLYLLSITILPIFLIFLTSAIMGAKIRTMWMTPFYLYFGTLVVYLFRNNINFNQLRVFSCTFVFIFLISPLLYGYISISKTDKRTDYNGKMIAQEIQDQWYKKNNTKINFVTGNEWIGGNLSYHLKSRPMWVGEILSDDKICFNENYKTTKFVGSKFCISSKNKKVSEQQ